MFLVKNGINQASKCRKILVSSFQIRAESYQASKLLEDPSNYTDYDVVHNPEEWKYVERLLPVKWIPNPKPKDSYPSGWVPQKVDVDKLPYYVERTKNHMLPVYLTIDDRGLQRQTLVRRVEGDIWKLSEELVVYLKPLMGYRTVGAKVDELKKTIFLRGDFLEYTKQFLIDKGL